MSGTDGNVYIGKFINGKKNDNKGTMRFADKGEYVGSWVDDISSGYGIMTFPNGDVYDGMFEGDKPNGHGIMQYHGGKIYDGQWKNGLQNGKGTETEDGYVRTGQFVNGKKLGHFGSIRYLMQPTSIRSSIKMGDQRQSRRITL